MNEIDFKVWLNKKGTKDKVARDTISRLKRIERELNQCDIDEHYQKDNCKYLLSLFENMGINENMKQYKNTSFPLGKYHMSVFPYAIRKYISFRDEFTSKH